MKEIECKTCFGEGVLMKMVCYGGIPFEKSKTCPDCDGDGYILIEEEADDVLVDILVGECLMEEI